MFADKDRVNKMRKITEDNDTVISKCFDIKLSFNACKLCTSTFPKNAMKYLQL